MPQSKKISLQEKTARKLQYYSRNNFGLWIECTLCSKWRKNYDYEESHEVEEDWCCTMNTLENGEKGSCDDPQEEREEIDLDYIPGSIVWAKLDGYPWWPAMVDENPDEEYFWWEEKGSAYYNITFLDKKVTRCWISSFKIRPFTSPPPLNKVKKRKVSIALSKAEKRGKIAMKMSIGDRLKNFSFVYKYKGKWPLLDEDNESEDNPKDQSDNLQEEHATNSAEKPDNPFLSKEKDFNTESTLENNKIDAVEQFCEVPADDTEDSGTVILSDTDSMIVNKLDKNQILKNPVTEIQVMKDQELQIIEECRIVEDMQPPIKKRKKTTKRSRHSKLSRNKVKSTANKLKRVNETSFLLTEKCHNPYLKKKMDFNTESTPEINKSDAVEQFCEDPAADTEDSGTVILSDTDSININELDKKQIAKNPVTESQVMKVGQELQITEEYRIDVKKYKAMQPPIKKRKETKEQRSRNSKMLRNKVKSSANKLKRVNDRSFLTEKRRNPFLKKKKDFNTESTSEINKSDAVEQFCEVPAADNEVSRPPIKRKKTEKHSSTANISRKKDKSTAKKLKRVVDTFENVTEDQSMEGYNEISFTTVTNFKVKDDETNFLKLVQQKLNSLTKLIEKNSKPDTNTSTIVSNIGNAGSASKSIECVVKEYKITKL